MDDLTPRLENALSAEGQPRPGDLSSVMARGRKLRRVRFASGALSAAIVLGAGGLGIYQLSSPSDPPGPSVANEAEQTSEGLVEPIPESRRSEIFAFRAVAAMDLMGPYHARSYNFIDEHDTTAIGDGAWSVAFAASDCAPRDNLYTCRPLSGEDPSGNASADTFVEVMLADGEWVVSGVSGNMLETERARLIGYSLPDRAEPSHWEFPAADFLPEAGTSLIPIWVGPYPTEARGSFCTVRLLAASGETIGKEGSFYQEPPDREFERAGWMRGGGGEEVKGGGERVADVAVDCHQYSGRGWDVVGEPDLVQGREGVVAIIIDLVWQGERGFTTPATCMAKLVDADGQPVWDGKRRLEPLRRDGELKDYPYRASITLFVQGDAVDAETVGGLTCTSP